MQTITKTYQTYRFEELDDKAKEQVLESYRTDEWYPGDWWHEAAVEDFVEDRTKEGWDLETKDVHFDVSYCQGSGASFDGTVNCLEWIKFHKLEADYPTIVKILSDKKGWDLDGNIHSNHYANHYCHFNTRYLEIEEDGQLEEYIYGWDNEKKEQPIIDGWNTELLELEKAIEADREQLSRDLEKTMYKEYEHYMSDETITEEIIVNTENQFLANGTPFNK